jgi:hypothetical protein
MTPRRKSALPKYEPPYLKRPMMQPGKGGYSHPNSPHPSQIPVGPPDHTLLADGASGKGGGLTYTPTPAYRSVE